MSFQEIIMVSAMFIQPREKNIKQKKQYFAHATENIKTQLLTKINLHHMCQPRPGRNLEMPVRMT
jgi:hypothetical protein